MRHWLTGTLFLTLLGVGTAQALTLQGKITETRSGEVPVSLSGAALKNREPGIVGLNMAIYPNDMPVVEEVYPDTPAQRVGIKPGDEVMAINQAATKGMSLTEVDDAISDVPGDKVHMTLNRNGYVYNVTVTVQGVSQVHQPSVRALYDSLLP